MSEQLELELEGKVERWEQFKSEVTLDELESLGQSIINVSDHLMTLCGESKGLCPVFIAKSEEAQALLNKLFTLQSFLGEESEKWFYDTMNSLGMAQRFLSMLESHPNKGVIEFV